MSFKEIKKYGGSTNGKNYFSFYIDIYRTDIDVCIGDEELFKYNFPEVEIKKGEDYGAITTEHKGRIGVLFKDKKQVSFSNINHEIVHLVDFVYENIGAIHQIDNPEPTAYLSGYIAGEISKGLKDLKIKIK